MRFIKVILVILLVSILLISLVFFARKQIAAYSINNYLLAHKAQLSCLDFDLTSALDIFINKACINTPQADIELINTRVQLSSRLQVSAINIDAMTINAKAKLFKQNNSEPPFIESDSFEHYLSKIAHFTLPLTVTVKGFTYLPFYQLDNYPLGNPQKPVFYGQLVANKNNINFSLKDNKQEDILSAEFVPKKESFSAILNTDLAKLTSLLAIHQLTLPAKLDKNITLEGKLATQLQWHEKTLTAKSQLNNFSIDSTTGPEQSGPLYINGMLSWQTTVSVNTALFMIDEQSLVNINFSDKKLLEFITTKNISADIIALVKDNPPHGLVIKPHGRIKIDFAKQQAEISNIEIASKNIEKPLQLTLTDAAFTYQTEHFFTPALTQAKFAVNAHLGVNKLNSLTKQAAKVAATGTLEQTDLGWKITLSPATTFELSKLQLSKPNQSSTKANNTAKTSNNNVVSIKNLFTHCQGHIDIDHHGLAELSLQLSSQALQLQAANIALIEQFDVKAKITGKLQDITMTASVMADKQPLANIKLSGEIAKPQFAIFADDLALTELLSLKLNLPIDISLIDGSVSFQLLGQLTDIGNWLNNSATVNISVQDVTGEIEGTWIQALNWSQRLTLADGYIKSASLDKKPNHNLTIAIIETAPPLTELSAQTTLRYKSKAFTIEATEINARLLGGKVNIAKGQWPFVASRSVDVQLTSIDLEELLALDPKQGIIVTGKISGDLPVSLNGKQFTISGGELHNISDGVIKVANNPTVEQLKESDPQLKLAFDAMQNIHYHLLSSDVSMADDGYMLFDTIIKGRNPDLDNEVNLNLNLSYDLLGLLKSLNITKHLEQTLIDQLQKN